MKSIVLNMVLSECFEFGKFSFINSKFGAQRELEFFNMSWKHFWLRNPQTKTDGYCVNSYGALNSLINNHTKKRKAYENICLTYNEIKNILKLKNKEEKYYMCDKLFKNKYF